MARASLGAELQGHTKMLNFFDVPNQMVLVDAPGYGERGRPEWGELFSCASTCAPRLDLTPLGEPC